MAKETVLAVALPAIATWGESETERDWRRVREAWKEIKETRKDFFPESVSDGGRERQGSKETSMAEGERARQRQRQVRNLLP